jgi:signal transduction histidine kinase
MRPVEVAADRAGADAAEPTLLTRNSELLASVCHDLKAPLASILMGAGFLRRVLPQDDATLMRVIDAIRHAAERMDQLVVDFRDLARLDMDDVKLDLGPHLAVPIVRGAIDSFVAQATAESVCLSLQLGPDASSLVVECDPLRLLQIVRQLLACALRIAPHDGSVEVSVRARSPGGIRFDFGVCPASSPGAELSKPQVAIARGLIERHGARLAIVSHAGSHEMSFTLPRALAEPS